MFRALSLCTCCRHYPGAATGCIASLTSSSRVSLPRYGGQVGLRIVLFEVCSAFTRVTACTLASSPYIVTNADLDLSRQSRCEDGEHSTRARRAAACRDRHLKRPLVVGTLSEGFSHFVTSIAAPVASGWSGCRVGSTHWKVPPLHGARQKRTSLNKVRNRRPRLQHVKGLPVRDGKKEHVPEGRKLHPSSTAERINCDPRSPMACVAALTKLTGPPALTCAIDDEVVAPTELHHALGRQPVLLLIGAGARHVQARAT